MQTTMPSQEAVSATLDAITKFQDYEARLKRFDWHFQFTDDGSAYRRAKADLDVLYSLQAEIDPQGEFWNLYKPDSFGVPSAVVATGDKA